MSNKFGKLIFVCFILTYLKNNCVVVHGLLFPQFTVMQIVAAVSWPIVDPDHKAFVNVGFQFNYNLPFAPSSFYDPMYWRSNKRALSATEQDPPNDAEDEVKNVTKRSLVDVDPYDRTKYQSALNNHMDISAGELYKSLETMLVDPSMHQAFGNNENYLKERYEAAEDIGRIGGDCEMVYSDCATSIIDNLSYLNGNDL